MVTTPLQHDTPQEMAQPLGAIKDWSKGECEPIPGKTMPQMVSCGTGLYNKFTIK